MTVEEKAVFDCLEDDLNVIAGAYDELDDDFLLMLNDGMPALEDIAKLQQPPMLDAEHENAGVVIIEDDENEVNPLMIPNYKEQMAGVIAMLDKQQEIRKFAVDVKLDYNESKNIEQQAISAVNQKALDDVFGAFLNKEYTDDQIGDLDGEIIDPLAFLEGQEGEEDDDMIDYGEMTDGDMESNLGPSQADRLENKLMQDNETINEAVNEFIQDKKGWFRQLHKDHKGEIEEEATDKGDHFLKGTAKFIGRGLIEI